MADEIQPTLSTPSQSRGLVRFNATRSEPHLLSLPDNVFHKLFNYLSWAPGAAGFRSGNAFNLSATCRQLNDYYRLNFAVKLRLDIGPSSPPDILFRALERLPRVRAIAFRQLRSLCFSDESHDRDAFKAYLDVLIETASMHQSQSFQSRALDIKEFSLSRMDCLAVDESQGHGTEVEVSAECVRHVVETFSNLETVCTFFLFIAIGDDAVTTISENLRGSLRTLSLLHLKKLSDVGGVRIGELHRLRKLDMRSCVGVTDATFDGMCALKELVELRLWDCSISDAAACRLVSSLGKLKFLCMASCDSVSDAVFYFLPRSLETLEIFDTIVNDFEGVPYSALEGVPNLTAFTACGCQGINNLSFLWPVAARLETLCLTAAGVSDTNAAHWVRQMPNLRELNLAATIVSDETARAVSSLGKILEACLDRTELTTDGVKALAGGIANQSLERVTLWDCPNVSEEDAAVHHLKRIVSGNSFRNAKLDSNR